MNDFKKPNKPTPRKPQNQTPSPEPSRPANFPRNPTRDHGVRQQIDESKHQNGSNYVSNSAPPPKK